MTDVCHLPNPGYDQPGPRAAVVGSYALLQLSAQMCSGLPENNVVSRKQVGGGKGL